MRRLFLELYHKQIFPSTPITSFSLFLSYIVVTPLMLGFEKDFSCHSHLGPIRIPPLFPFPSAEIYYSLFQIDIVKKRTLSSLALDIFRTLYYDQKKWPIYIPNRNEDTFIRRGYYGGHSDTYIPYGKELYYYDVNSLYPHVMKKRSLVAPLFWVKNVTGSNPVIPTYSSPLGSNEGSIEVA